MDNTIKIATIENQIQDLESVGAINIIYKIVVAVIIILPLILPS